MKIIVMDGQNNEIGIVKSKKRFRPKTFFLINSKDEEILRKVYGNIRDVAAKNEGHQRARQSEALAVGVESESKQHATRQYHLKIKED